MQQITVTADPQRQLFTGILTSIHDPPDLGEHDHLTSLLVALFDYKTVRWLFR